MSLEKRARDYSASTAAPAHAAGGKALHARVSDALAGLRLDQALARLFPDYSRSRLQSWVKSARVTVDGVPAQPRDKVWGGERIALRPDADADETQDLAQNIPLNIVFEDHALLVIDKPAGLVVHPGSGNRSGTMMNALLHHAPALARLPRAGIVHRLDKDTSGLMVVAKTLVAQTALVRQMQARSVKREYLALVWGELDRPYTINVPIGRHPTQRVKMATTESGKEAVTHVSVEERFPYCTLVRCRLETGRTHQIRVHMTHIGHPLIGDAVYQRGTQKCSAQLRELLNGFPRQALHATRLALDHPVTGERMQFDSPLPDDMEELLERIDEASDAVE
jgi:23S rRNA pseudouridine1911/1915/1917 synthase